MRVRVFMLLAPSLLTQMFQQSLGEQVVETVRTTNIYSLAENLAKRCFVPQTWV